MAKKRDPYPAATVKAVCGILGVKREQLRRYESYGAPRNEDGSWDLTQLVPWLLGHERDRLKREETKAVDALELERRERAMSMKLRRQELQGELGPLKHFRKVVWGTFRGFRRRLEAFPRAVAQDLAELTPRRLEMRLEEKVRDLLDSFSSSLTAQAGEAPPAEKPKRRKKKPAKKRAARKRKAAKK